MLKFACETEIADQDITILAQKQIIELDVAMHNSHRMHVHQGACGLPDHLLGEAMLLTLGQ